MFIKTFIAVVLVHTWNTERLFCEQAVSCVTRVSVLDLTENWEQGRTESIVFETIRSLVSIGLLLASINMAQRVQSPASVRAIALHLRG
jgi:hypothetical protein